MCVIAMRSKATFRRRGFYKKEHIEKNRTVCPLKGVNYGDITFSLDVFSESDTWYEMVKCTDRKRFECFRA